MPSYKLVIGMAEGQSADALAGFFASEGTRAIGPRRWRVGEVMVAVSTGRGRSPHATVHVPLLEAEPPAEEAVELAFRLARALSSQVFDPQLNRVVQVSDTAEIVEQVAAHWEPPVAESRIGRAIGDVVRQSTLSMVATLLLAAVASAAAVVYLDIPDRHIGNALFIGLLLFALLFSALRFFLLRALPSRHERVPHPLSAEAPVSAPADAGAP